jgi:16S rRNA (guanine527-N7)-methyltransferase
MPAYTALMQDLIRERLGAAGHRLSARELEQLEGYVELLARWNRVHNLTAITEPAEVVRRHLSESLALREFLRGARIADVGSGAGLPGIPLAIVEPERQFVLIESRAKRARFLEHVRGALGLDHVTVEHCRAEDLRGIMPFDTVLARAVAALPVLVELTEHLIGHGGVLLVPTKADIGPVAERVDPRFVVRRIEGGGSALLEGALVAVERAAR